MAKSYVSGYVNVNFDSKATGDKLLKSIAKAQKKLDTEVVKDTEPYVPFKSGALARSGQRYTVYGSGKVIYKTPYAQKQYNEFENKNKQFHPKASIAWFHKSKRLYMKKWLDMVKKIAGDF